MRQIAILAVAALLGAASLQASQQGSQQPPPPPADKKTDAKAPATVVGKWNMSVDTPQGSMASLLDMQADPKDAKKLTGMLSSEMGSTPLQGEFSEGKLTFSISFDGGGGPMELWFSGTLKDDGTLEGSLDTPQGQIPWRAQRVKDE